MNIHARMIQLRLNAEEHEDNHQIKSINRSIDQKYTNTDARIPFTSQQQHPTTIETRLVGYDE